MLGTKANVNIAVFGVYNDLFMKYMGYVLITWTTKSLKTNLIILHKVLKYNLRILIL
jgi:hypothetical protein